MAITPPDAFIQIDFPLGEDVSALRVETNLKDEVILDMIAEYIHSQIGRGVDERTANELEQYRLTLFFWLDGDRWAIDSDCNNGGLEMGILMRCLKLIEENPDCINKKRRTIDDFWNPSMAEMSERWKIGLGGEHESQGEAKAAEEAS